MAILTDKTDVTMKLNVVFFLKENRTHKAVHLVPRIFLFRNDIRKTGLKK